MSVCECVNAGGQFLVVDSLSHPMKFGLHSGLEANTFSHCTISPVSQHIHFISKFIKMN